MRLGTLNLRGNSEVELLGQIMTIADLDVLCLTETWSSQTNLLLRNRELAVSGPARRGSSTHYHGGVQLIARPGFYLRYRAHLRTDNAQVIITSLQSGLTIIGAYIAPVRGQAVMQSILAWIRPWMRGGAVLMGDLNSRHKRWDVHTNNYGKLLSAWASDNRLDIYAPTTATCITSSGASTIDLFLSRQPRLDNVEILPGTWDYCTDHRLVIASVCPPVDATICRVPRRLFSDNRCTRRAKEVYKDTLPGIKQQADDASTASQLDEATSAWQAAILRPWLHYCRTAPGRFRPGWFHDLDKLAKERSRLIHRAERGDDTSRTAAKELDKKIKRKQRARRRALARMATVPPTGTTRQISAELDGAVRYALISESFGYGPPPVAYGAHLRQALRNDQPVEPATFTTPEEFGSAIELAITNMKPGTAAGPDGISPRMLQVVPEIVGPSLLAIWRAVGRLGYVPLALRIGRVAPVHKKGDRRQASNYRLICVLNVMRRTISAAINQRIRRASTFHYHQWGFRKQTGTEHAIAHLKSQRQKGLTYIAVLDLKSAYDRASRQKLLNILQERLPLELVGMCTAILAPGEAYVNGAPLHRFKILSGVPQGDPLIPTLFNFLMDELLQEIDRHIGPEKKAGSCYADDVLLMAQSRQDLQRSLDVASQWASDQDMTWNIQKSAELIDWNSTPHNPLTIANEALPCTEKVRHLGISLTWAGISPDALSERLDLALMRMGKIARAPALQHLPYNCRRYIILTHVFSLVDYASHLCPLPPSVRAKAATLERRSCAWVLDSGIRLHQTIRARALARLPPVHVRRKLSAMRRTYGARIELQHAPPDSMLARRARLLLEDNCIQTEGSTAPYPPANLREALQATLRTEWTRTMAGRRPIPMKYAIPLALKSCTPPLLHVISAYYLNTIPATT